jgi:hypothetical protein
MKIYNALTIAALFMAVLMAVMTGCKYDVAEPLWYGSFTAPPTPSITQINPSVAGGGVNTITIVGENFGVTPDTNSVYFNNVSAEILSASATSITVRRPNLVTDSATVMVVPPKALVVAKYAQPYKITSVSAKYGAFVSNAALSAPAVGPGEVLYVVDQSSKAVIAVTTGGDKTTLATATRVPFEIKVHNGKLILLGNNRSIEMIDLATNTLSEWVKLATGKNAKYGDFDANGYFYTGSLKTDLFILSNATPPVPTASGIYAKDEILGVRVFNGYLYVLIKAGTPTADNPATALWKHSIGAGGVLGARQLVLDWTKTAFSTLAIKGLSFSASGIIYFATDGTNPMLTYDPTTNAIDILYKGILPTYCDFICWGTGQYIYMIRGNTSASEEWTVYRIDTGVQGAPYY